MAILDAEKLIVIRKHRYRCEGHEILSFLEPGFDKIAEMLPQNISPNGLTITGLVSTIIPCILVIWYEHAGSTEAVQQMTSWCTLGFFVWLVCDTVDGKVARLRGLCGPFGELLDHGGDCFAFMLASMAIACLLRVSECPEMFLMWIVADLLANYISEAYTMYICNKYHYASFDFLEVLCAFVCIGSVSAVYGLEIWAYKPIAALGFRLRHIFYIVKFIMIADVLFVKSRELYNAAKDLQKPKMQVLAPLVPLIVVTSSTLVSFCLCSREFIQGHSVLFLLCFGFSFMKIHIQLLLAQMTKSRIQIFDYALLFPIFATYGIIFCETPTMEMHLIQKFTIITFLDSTVYFFRLVYEFYRGLRT